MKYKLLAILCTSICFQQVALAEDTSVPAGKADGLLSVAIGDSAVSNGVNSVAIIGTVGDKTGDKENGNFGIAIGSEAHANYLSTSIGAFSSADSTGSLAVGSKAVVETLNEGETVVSGSGGAAKKIIKDKDGNVKIEIGTADKEQLKKDFGDTYGATAIGLGASSHEMMTTSVGAFATTAAEDTTAIGHGATAIKKGAVALGDDSIADREMTVSVGSKGEERQITNVKAGVEETDAVNVSQLKHVGNNISQNTKDINNLKSSMSSNMDSLRNDINNNKKDINSLRTEMRRGLASQSALNGLFQPYGVNKLNFTAAVGGYESDTAIAVGSGYRFNENIAAKVGVATNTGNFEGASYNAGINVEW